MWDNVVFKKHFDVIKRRGTGLTKSYDAMFALGVVISHVKFVRIVNFVDKISKPEKSKFIPPFALNPKVSQRFTP